MTIIINELCRVCDDEFDIYKNIFGNNTTTCSSCIVNSLIDCKCRK